MHISEFACTRVAFNRVFTSETKKALGWDPPNRLHIAEFSFKRVAYIRVILYLGTQLVNCQCTHTHPHTHILSLMTDSRHSTPERGHKSVMCPAFETAVTLSSGGCHTLCAPSRGPCAPSCSLRDQAKNRSSLFHFKVTGGQ